MANAAGCPVLVLDEPATGPAAELLTDTELSALYGVPVSTLAYSDDGQPGRTIVVHYRRP